ncbi:cytochrome P450 monooxygenase pc-2 [Crassisporium funariophilum]|nr:cytochrome P450 monooxygenase pc-2 [Crassisporium funariophilum]
MAIPPGINYLAHHLPQLALGPFSAYAIIQTVQWYFHVKVETWVVVLSLISSGPILFAVNLAFKDFKDYRVAAALGAELPPRILDYSPGNIYTIYKEIEGDKTGYIGEMVDVIAEQMGGFAFNLRLLFQNRIVTAEPDHIKAILATQFDVHEKGPEVRHVLSPMLGSGVFAVDGEMWKFHRSLTRPFFTKDRISDFDTFEHRANDAIRQLKVRLREGFAVDIQDVAARFTLDSATEFLFGHDVRSLAAGIPYPYNSSKAEPLDSGLESDPAARFAKAFSEAQAITVARARFGYNWPLIEFWSDRMVKPMSIVRELIDPIVAQAVATRKTSMFKKGDATESEKTLLEELVNSTDDPVLLRDEIMSLLVAGRDTTASTVTFIVYMLAEHPNVLRRLREEILAKVGAQRRPTYENIKEMKYLRAVINETLRLYPAVPFNLRMSKQATTWAPNQPGGKPFHIPAGTRIAYGIFNMHRRKDLWGPDAQEFDPDRFLDERLHKYLTPNPFIFLPFNAGPRICLGQQFAYNEASFFIVRLLQNFSNIYLSEDAQPPASRAPEIWAGQAGRKGKERIKPGSHLTMFLHGGLWVNMEEANTVDGE